MSSLYNIIEGPEIIIKKIKNGGTLSDSIIKEILDLEQRFKPYLVSNIFDIKKDRLIEIFIHNCQQRLTLLSNEVYNSLKSAPYMDAAQKCLDIVDELLHFLEDSFPRYFNRFENISLKHRSELLPELRTNVNTVLEKFQMPIIQEILKPVLEFINGSKNFNYHQVDYFNSLINHFLDFDSSENESDFLKRTLIIWNYNSLTLLHYFISEIQDEIEEMSTLKHKIYHLNFYLKWLNQLPSGNKTFFPEQKDLHVLLTKWLSEEISFLEKNYHVSESIEKDAFKFLTELTVSQLAFMLRLFFDLKLILNDNNKEAVQFLAQHAKTKSGEDISPTSLHNKFYNVKPVVIEQVKGILIRLLNQVHKY